MAPARSRTYPGRGAAAEAQPHVESDVLELTEEVHEEEGVVIESPAVETQPRSKTTSLSENIEAEPKAEFAMDTTI